VIESTLTVAVAIIKVKSVKAGHGIMCGAISPAEIWEGNRWVPEEGAQINVPGNFFAFLTYSFLGLRPMVLILVQVLASVPAAWQKDLHPEVRKFCAIVGRVRKKDREMKIGDRLLLKR
jgi:hypothetical protein